MPAAKADPSVATSAQPEQWLHVFEGTCTATKILPSSVLRAAATFSSGRRLLAISRASRQADTREVTPGASPRRPLPLYSFILAGAPWDASRNLQHDAPGCLLSCLLATPPAIGSSRS